MRKTILDIASRKGPSQEPLVCLTAYTAPMARAVDPHCDLLLVGDSVAMVLYGEPTTLQADMDMMIRHGRAVVKASAKAMVVVDMPFGSYQEGREQAFRNAAHILRETGASAVKIEGGDEMADTVRHLSARGVPVMGHVGLLPQSVNASGGFRVQGRDEAAARKILKDAKSIADAGAFAIVVEGVPETLAAEMTKAVSCPVIGIGASVKCDGQILVAEDMLGLTRTPRAKFVKAYAELSDAVGTAAEQYAKDVKARAFPANDHIYQSIQITQTPVATSTTPAFAPAPAPVMPPETPSIKTVAASNHQTALSQAAQPAPQKTTASPSMPVIPPRTAENDSAPKAPSAPLKAQKDEPSQPSSNKPLFDMVLRATKRT